MTTHDYKTIAAIVGADKIDALRDAGVDIADKTTKPTTNLMGRWAKHPAFGDVMILSQCPDELNMVPIANLSNTLPGGVGDNYVDLWDLTFPEETTRPEDVPVGEAWLVTLDDGEYSAERINAVKLDGNKWVIGSRENIAKIWKNREVTLIAPLIPARPQDVDRGESPETVTTEDEYAALPEGSIVAFTGGNPWLKDSDGKWEDGPSSVAGIAYVPRQVLRRGWGE